MQAEVHAKPLVSLPESVRAEFFEIVEPTLHIQNQDQFIKWSQTELQRILPHGRLVCGVGRLGTSGPNVHHVMACNFPQEYIQGLQRADGLICSPILEKWIRVKRPVLFEPDSITDAITIPLDWLDRFRSFGLVNMAMHGQYDVHTHAASYFCFSGIPGVLNLHHAYILKLLVPHMHAALIRVVLNTKSRKRSPNPQQAKLTPREEEIVQWLATGKSNWEIAQVVGLSEATVKNHVHHILQSLQVSSRTQAVARAIHSKLISVA